eukprot:1261863-Pyramimonas_sp.AAC.1
MKLHIQSKGVTLPWFGEGNKQLMSRSEHNNRSVQANVRQYARGILRGGITALVRGNPIAVATDRPGEYELLAGATLMEAFYEAFAADPQNEYVAAGIEDGYQDCAIVKLDTPVDVLQLIKEVHNNYHLGCGQTHIEKYEIATQSVEAAWKVEVDLKSLSVQACPKRGPFSYAALYAEFVKTKFKNTFPEWEPHDNAKAFWHKMEALKLDQWYKSLCEAACNFMDPLLDVNYLLSVNNAIKTTVFAKCFSDLYNNDILSAVLKELVHFGFPTDPFFDKAMADAYPFLLGSRSNGLALVKRLNAPISSSK